MAIPKREIKPTTSVIVVKITPPARAGSMFILAKINGKVTPLMAPMIKLIIKAEAMTGNIQDSEDLLSILNESLS